MSQKEEDIINEIKLKLAKALVPVDNDFALENLEYITEELGNDRIKAIYRLLGPFDYNSYNEKAEEELLKGLQDASDAGSSSQNYDEESRVREFGWQTRKSGAQYRGEVSAYNKRPDGQGIKVFNGKSMYEGYFQDGKCHGYGRGITGAGEVYQGGFNEDQMDGDGFFHWPDGRIYEGEFNGGKRHGKGKFFWTNGQVYEGDFKLDECSGFGFLYYPDGKCYEGNWRDGKKNGKGTYVFPNGASYQVVYADGKKKSQGTLINTEINMDELKNQYRSLAKKSQYARDYLKKHAHVREQPKKRGGRGMMDDDAIGILNPKRGGGGDSYMNQDLGMGRTPISNDQFGGGFNDTPKSPNQYYNN